MLHRRQYRRKTIPRLRSGYSSLYAVSGFGWGLRLPMKGLGRSRRLEGTAIDRSLRTGGSV